MQRRTVLAFVLVLFSSTSSLAAESRSDDFIRQAIEGNVFEVKAGELAQSKGERPTVREFGAMLAKDHAQARVKSERAAKAIGAKVPTSPSQTQREVLDALAKLQGDAFDQHFIKSMLEDHLRDVARYDTQSKQGTDAVAKYASETLPTLRDHLKAVQGLANERSTQ